MSCASNLIGLKACNLDEPATGLYIDSLGLSKSYLDKLVSDQYNDGTELFVDKRDMAFNKLRNDFINRWAQVLTGQTVADNARVGQVNINFSNLQSIGPNYQGIRIRFSPNNTAFLKLNITSVEVLKANAAKTVFIYDLIKEVVIETLTVPVGGKHFLIQIPAHAKRMDVAIVWQMDQDVPKTTVRGKNTCMDCGGGWGWEACSRGVQAIPIEVELGSSMELLSMSSAQFTAGISLLYSLECDYDVFLCSLGGIVALPLLYATGIEIVDYGLTISAAYRSNAAVDFNVEGLQKLREILVEKYNTEIQTWLRGFVIPDDGFCFKCTQPFKYVTALP